ncbi:MAG: 3-dehydroquinate synthase [Clostridia bacterium]|nr:3-dehydroquinate synthase [Clostridia bacterium]
MKTIRMNLPGREYDITVGRGLRQKAGEIFRLDRKVMILTDDGVPAEYAEAVLKCSKEAKILTLPMGEDTKSFASLELILTEMLSMNMTRQDCLVAVGGGVIGDLGGFAAACYMRGIDFYNMPTTLLSMVDSSIGGKTAINLGGAKNTVGAFHQPKAVLIDADCLATLDDRQKRCGIAEIIKMAATSNEKLFEKLEKSTFIDILADIEDIILSALEIKRAVVEEDEHEGGLRRILNFGHTIGHCIEASSSFYHGESVALGMLPMCRDSVKERLLGIYERIGLPTEYDADIDEAMKLVSHDKKSVEGGVWAVLCPEVGSFEIKKMKVPELCLLAKRTFA